MTVFVDTSALYAVLDADDDEHARARAEWRRLVRGSSGLLTTSYVLVETTALVQHRLGMEAVGVWSRTGRSSVERGCTQPASMLAAGRRGLSLVDCVSFAVMARAGLRQAFAFDDHFAGRGFSCLPAAADPQAGSIPSPV